MQCPYCQSQDSRVIDTSHDSRGGIRRRRECQTCERRFTTYERAVQATPMLVKQDGTREAFDREKLIRGIRISCAKRPVAAADIERLVGEIEAALQAMGQAEVSSRVVGDMAISGLRSSTTSPTSDTRLSIWAWTIFRPFATKSTPSSAGEGPVRAFGGPAASARLDGVSHRDIRDETRRFSCQGC